MLPRIDRRQRLLLAACVAAQVAVVAAVAATQPTDGALSVVVALALAPVAVLGVAATAARLRDGAFPVAACATYVLLPFLGNRFVLGGYRSAFDRHALPALVGVQATAAFALGVGAIVAAALLPPRVTAAAGGVALVAALVAWPPGKLADLQPMLHETAWSVALAEWLLVATIVAVILRRPPLGIALGCLALAVVLRAAHQPLDDEGFWRALGPLAPAGGVLVSSLWLLVPRLRPAAARQAAS